MGELSTLTAASAARFLTVPDRGAHKYSRGVLGLRTGSTAYPGAAVLGAEAAWRTGIGLVQFFPQLGDDEPAFGLPSPAAAVLAQRPETVVSHAPGRCDAWLIGSGTDGSSRAVAEQTALKALMEGAAPIVIDAGALDLSILRATGRCRTAPVVLTPHAGEFASIWEALGARRPPADSTAATELARSLDATVLLKGSVTIAAAPDGSIFRVGPATPWLATAGTGDVLAGILGALAASHAGAVREDPALLAELGATAALIHDSAARIAAGDPRRTEYAAGRPITALDVARTIPAAVEQLRESQI
ncbi:MAG: NAD(P)H-hydrate dehydratase [Leucobacter sp.]|nr:NAD(P)H-hydrate dehydratase [Leucobacter sp.]